MTSDPRGSDRPSVGADQHSAEDQAPDFVEGGPGMSVEGPDMPEEPEPGPEAPGDSVDPGISLNPGVDTPDHGL